MITEANRLGISTDELTGLVRKAAHVQEALMI
jgi:hypothetical protein